MCNIDHMISLTLVKFTRKLKLDRGVIIFRSIFCNDYSNSTDYIVELLIKSLHAY